uniref:Uncharacterized protein n=1 Tax=Streptomyces sp. NBC_00049 TaxID=2903617 RepID=A0AAU2JI34_9ACTN
MSVGRTARLVVRNGGQEVLEVYVEPWGDVHRIEPEQSCVILTHSEAGDGTWPGTSYGDEPFEVVHRPDGLMVWANGHCFHLAERDGEEIYPYVYGGCPAQPPGT